MKNFYLKTSISVVKFFTFIIYLLVSMSYCLAGFSKKEKNTSSQSFKKYRKSVWIGATSVAASCLIVVYICNRKDQTNNTQASNQVSVGLENIIAFQNFEWCDIDKETSIILFTTGSYRLPHPGHILPMVNLRKFLNQKGYKNVELMFSPSHNHWFQHKRKKGTVHEHINPSWEKRKDLLESLIGSLVKNQHISQKERNSMSVTDIENKDKQINYPVASKMISDKFKEKTVIYCSGQDLWEKHTHVNPYHAAFKRDMKADFSSTKIIEKEQPMLEKLKAMVPEYYCDIFEKPSTA